MVSINQSCNRLRPSRPVQEELDIRMFESASKAQKGHIEVVTLHFAAFQAKGAGKQRTSLGSSGTCGSSGRKAGAPGYSEAMQAFSQNILRVPSAYLLLPLRFFEISIHGCQFS